MEYVVGPLLALLIGLKFTDYRTKQVSKQYDSLSTEVDKKIVEQNTMISKQTLRILTPVAASVNKINQQLGLWDKIDKKLQQ